MEVFHESIVISGHIFVFDFSVTMGSDNTNQIFPSEQNRHLLGTMHPSFLLLQSAGGPLDPLLQPFGPPAETHLLKKTFVKDSAQIHFSHFCLVKV